MALMCLDAVVSNVYAQGAPHLEVESRIPLGEVRGRIDHLALDLEGSRLFVAELGNGTVGVIDLKQRKVVQRLTGFEEPQGVAWSSQRGMLYVASGGDGTLRTFAGADLAKQSVVTLGDDADNIRLTADEQQVYVGFGRGALATLDAATLKRLPDLRLPGHPESFQLQKDGMLAFVNVPDVPEITVVNRSAQTTRHWSTKGARSNYPMALDETQNRLFAVFRQPALLEVHSTKDGSLVARVPTCGDADDIFLDDVRHLAYIVCGEGRIDLIETQSGAYRQVGTTPTVSGARTGYYSRELDRLFLAARASGNEPAAIWVLHPR